MNNTSMHVIKKLIQTQWFFKLREYSIKKRRFIFCRWKPCYKVFKYNGPSIGLTDFVRLCCSASECDEQQRSDSRPWRWRIDFKISELVVGELTRWQNDCNFNIWTCSIDGTAVSHTFVRQNETFNGHSSQAKSHKLAEEEVEYKVRCTNLFCRVLVAR